MVDANIIISAGLFPESNIGKALKHIMQKHSLVLCQYTLEELREVFERKFIKRIEYLNKFVNDLKYELINIEINDYTKYPQVRDKDDTPLLAYATESKIDILITGDKDFDEIRIEHPRILKVRDYIEEYMNIENKGRQNCV
jgi:putative PIN family toxin of toxin-antitoxin system